MISINERAWALAQQMSEEAEALHVASFRLENGATVIDAGIQVPGSYEAGRLFSEICLGGLGRVSFGTLQVGEHVLAGVTVEVSHPVVACMASQYAGWALRKEGFFAMGSGPARALYAGEPLFEALGFRDQSEVAVLALEGAQLPTAEAADKVASKCRVAPEGVMLLIAPTASLVGSVQVAARVVETGMHKMHEVGFDIHCVQAGLGSCPLAPIAKSDIQAIGRTNDGVLYGGRAWYTVQAEDSELEAVIERLPSLSSRDYGESFYELFRRYDGDFYRIDPLLFSPAVVSLNNAISGRSFSAGRVNPQVIASSWWG